MDEEKKKYVQIERWEVPAQEGEKFIYVGRFITTVEESGTLIDEINESETGYWTAKIVWMTEAEFDSFKDFFGTKQTK